MNDEVETQPESIDEDLDAEDEVRVLLINRRDVVRRGLRAVIEDSDDVVVVGDAARLDDTGRMIDRTELDVAILDATEPTARIVDTVDTIRRVQANVPVLVHGRTDAEEAKRIAWAAGADGYLLDDARGKDVLQLVRRIARGDGSHGLQAVPTAVVPADEPGVSDLTLRERQVLRLIAAGMTNRQIGLRLGLAEKTIKNYVSGLLAKLHLESRTQAAVYRVIHDESTHSGPL
ncbi:response regulator transcription factor [Microbacterium sp. NE2HP2]|uniref:LuxR C-terminal-related transcriptional regulator n=1 Tax=Microbacterium plantarum TaxID=1816425 RepID=UPI002366BDE9|nr:response regulator transcription factor [Microbacterium plantarum]MDD7944571.1 response regulator transcription factor [Microbacterium plantarum]